MIRAAVTLFVISAVVVVALALAGEPGRASIQWLGWRLDMTAAAAILITLFAALAATVFWRAVLWIVDTPKRNARIRAEARRRQGADALTRGFLSAAAGDGSEARRQAQKAADLADDAPALVRILAAQAAEAAGDAVAAKAAWTAMLGFPDMRLAALRGLMQNALASGDRAGALRYAQEAYSLTKTARWAWRALLEDRLEAGDWAAALELVKTALERKIVSPIVAERARAALLAASAASGEERRAAQALEFALQSAKLRPGFTPAAVIGARILAAEGKIARAGSLIEAAWKEEPHPALWLTYRDMKTNETPRERAKRLEGLALLNPMPRESRILMVEQALTASLFADAQRAAETLKDEPPTARLCGLMARLSYGAGDTDQARVWMARGAAAPAEQDWSDIDPEGVAFAYSPADWARLVSTYAETGELIHPRFERREAVISDLPRMPVAYEAAPPFVTAAELGLTPIPVDDPGAWGASGFDGASFDEGPDPDSAPPSSSPRRAPAPRRRLGSPRAK